MIFDNDVEEEAAIGHQLLSDWGLVNILNKEVAERKHLYHKLKF